VAARDIGVGLRQLADDAAPDRIDEGIQQALRGDLVRAEVIDDAAVNCCRCQRLTPSQLHVTASIEV
jgi:CO dehydrogenase/acetyl-CoA synthase alpha subunit